MIPLVGEVKELKFVKDVVVKVADELIKASGVDMKYLVGTMIEIPRAAPVSYTHLQRLVRPGRGRCELHPQLLLSAPHPPEGAHCGPQRVRRHCMAHARP